MNPPPPPSMAAIIPNGLTCILWEDRYGGCQCVREQMFPYSGVSLQGAARSSQISTSTITGTSLHGPRSRDWVQKGGLDVVSVAAVKPTCFLDPQHRCSLPFSIFPHLPLQHPGTPISLPGSVGFHWSGNVQGRALASPLAAGNFAGCQNTLYSCHRSVNDGGTLALPVGQTIKIGL